MINDWHCWSLVQTCALLRGNEWTFPSSICIQCWMDAVTNSSAYPFRIFYVFLPAPLLLSVQCTALAALDRILDIVCKWNLLPYTSVVVNCIWLWTFRTHSPFVLLHSTIGYWHRHAVRLSVCAFWLSRLVYRAKSCTGVFLAGKFLFVPSDTFAVGCVVFY